MVSPKVLLKALFLSNTLLWLAHNTFSPSFLLATVNVSPSYFLFLGTKGVIVDDYSSLFLSTSPYSWLSSVFLVRMWVSA